VSSTEVFQRVAAPALYVELSTVMATASNPDLGVGEECRRVDLNAAVGEGARSMDLLVARSLPEAVAATWKVHRLFEILPTTSWVLGYYENPVTQ
jgi:hypothetical protein